MKISIRWAVIIGCIVLFWGGSEHILLVDDQKEVIRIERLILEVLGYRVATRLSGKDALEKFAASSSTYDMVITDMNMSHMSGETRACELMSIKPDIPVILLTGYHEGMTRDKARALGIKDFLMKSVSLRSFPPPSGRCWTTRNDGCSGIPDKV